MAYVFSTPKLEPMETRNRYILAAAWTVRTPGLDFTVPAGFTFDGASIPRFLWRLCGSPYDAPRVIAALAHDFLYSVHVCDRKTADAIYRDMQITLGIAGWKARVEYAALRIFGSAAWRKAAILAALGLASLFVGCATKTRTVDLAGLYASETGTLAIGQVEVMAAPQGEESATIKYAEDNAWLAPSMKKHSIKIMLTGSNSVDKVNAIVERICTAFSKVTGEEKENLNATISPAPAGSALEAPASSSPAPEEERRIP